MITRTDTAERTLPDIFYEEPEPIEDGMRQESTISLFMVMLRQWFRGRNIFVGAGGFIFWNTANGNDRVSPDGMVALDTDPGLARQFPNYLMWEVGKAPDLVMEVASPSTARNDLGHKRDLYARLEIPEYWKFDLTGGELYGTPLLGEQLVNGEYVPYELNEEPDGSVWSHSEVLGLQFWWDGLDFDIRDPLTGRSINTAVIAEWERTRANMADQRAERERQMRLEMEARLRELSERLGQDENVGENSC